LGGVEGDKRKPRNTTLMKDQELSTSKLRSPRCIKLCRIIKKAFRDCLGWQEFTSAIFVLVEQNEIFRYYYDQDDCFSLLSIQQMDRRFDR
jgi:hypothetical protein